jgi:hypothetical protein
MSTCDERGFWLVYWLSGFGFRVKGVLLSVSGVGFPPRIRQQFPYAQALRSSANILGGIDRERKRERKRERERHSHKDKETESDRTRERGEAPRRFGAAGQSRLRHTRGRCGC